MPTNVIKTLFTLIFCISFSMIANSQITERAKTRAENRANRRVDQKIDNAVDRSLDKIEGLFRKKKENQTTEENRENRTEADYEEEVTEEEVQASIFSALNMGGEFEPYENPVRMNVSMDVTTVNQRGKEDKMNIKYTFDTWATAMELDFDGKRMRILLDNKEGFQTMVTEDNGEVQAIKMRQKSFDFEDFVPDEGKYTVTETAKTRTIDGYLCKEYIIEHEEEGTTNSWITQDVDIDMMTLAKAMSAQARGQKNMSIWNFYDLKGFPIEAVNVSKNGKETTTVRFHGIKVGNDVNLDAFNLDGIEVMSIGF